MKRYDVARVAADPPIVEQSRAPGGSDGMAYFRLHGSPRMYWSRYDPSYLLRLANVVRHLSVGRCLVRVRQYGMRIGLRKRLGNAEPHRVIVGVSRLGLIVVQPLD
jgi:hypothetical protein